MPSGALLRRVLKARDLLHTQPDHCIVLMLVGSGPMMTPEQAEARKTTRATSGR